MLIKNGANVTSADKEGWTALHMAALAGNSNNKLLSFDGDT